MAAVFLAHAPALVFVFGHFEAQTAARILVLGA